MQALFTINCIIKWRVCVDVFVDSKAIYSYYGTAGGGQERGLLRH